MSTVALNERPSSPKKGSLSIRTSRGTASNGLSTAKIDPELEECVRNMKNPVFGYPLMDFSQVNLA
jgi:hypothetical protein